MLRNVLGAVLALLGATLAVVSPFHDWYDGQAGRDYRLRELFTAPGVESSPAGLLAGVAPVMVVAALIALLAIVTRSRLLMALSGVTVLALTVLWLVRQHQTDSGLALGKAGLGAGVGSALAGGLLLLGAGALMAGRRVRRRAREIEVPSSGAAGSSQSRAEDDSWPAGDAPTSQAAPATDRPPWGAADQPPSRKRPDAA